MIRSWFSRFSNGAAWLTGRPSAFLLALLVVIVWAATGPMFRYSDTWQLVINTGTTIVTFLMVFLIQNTQNRETVAIQLKLDELIRASRGAHNALLDLEQLSAEELIEVRDKYERLARLAREELDRGGTDLGSPEVEGAGKPTSEADVAADVANARAQMKSRRAGRGSK
jgi:low affinity Fe/Cu permease